MKFPDLKTPIPPDWWAEVLFLSLLAVFGWFFWTLYSL